MEKRKSEYYTKVSGRAYQPNKQDMNMDVSVPTKPERLVQAIMRGGAVRRKPKD